MNTKKDGQAENEQLASREAQSQNERSHTHAQRLLREQRDIARITTFGRRDE
jgi:hypothetical protein